MNNELFEILINLVKCDHKNILCDTQFVRISLRNHLEDAEAVLTISEFTKLITITPSVSYTVEFDDGDNYL